MRSTVNFSSSLTEGEDDGVKGASPTHGTVSCTNWPARKLRGRSGATRNVLIVGVSVVTSSRSAQTGL